MNKYDNLRFWSRLSSGKELKSEAEINRIAQIRNPILLEDLNNAAKSAGVIPVITTIIEGVHGDLSRHYAGLAVDIAAFSGIGGSGAGASFKNAGKKLSVALQQMGYKLNVENGNDKAVLWQTKGHFGHLHVSNKSNIASDFDPTKPVSVNNGDPTNANSFTYNEPLSETPTGLQYFHFDQEFIERGIRLYKEYYNKRDIEDNKEGKGSGDLGFIPLLLDIKFEGISGWIIYDKIKLNQNILPPQYPKNFNFVIMGVNHSIKNHDWETNIQVLSVPDVLEKEWKRTDNLTTSPKAASVPNNGGVYSSGGSYKDTLYRDTESPLKEEAKRLCSEYRGTSALTEFEWVNLIAGINAESGNHYVEEAYTAACILNRSRIKKKYIKDVMMEKGQFSSVIGGTGNWINGPSKTRRDHIYKGIIDNLKSVDRNFQFFASTNPKAYETATDGGRGAQKIQNRKNKGYIVVGNSLFGKVGV